MVGLRVVATNRSIDPKTETRARTRRQQVLQDPRRLPAVAVPDDVDRVVFPPSGEQPDVVRLTVAGVPVSTGVLMTVVHSATFQLVENLARPARSIFQMRGGREQERGVGLLHILRLLIGALIDRR